LYYFCLDDCHDNQLYKHSEPNAVLLLLLLGAFSLGLRRCPWKERSVAVEQLLLGGAAGEQGDHKALLLVAAARRRGWIWISNLGSSSSVPQSSNGFEAD